MTTATAETTIKVTKKNRKSQQRENRIFRGPSFVGQWRERSGYKVIRLRRDSEEVVGEFLYMEDAYVRAGKGKGLLVVDERGTVI